MKLALITDTLAGSMVFRLEFDARDAELLVSLRPPGSAPWMKFDGRQPSAILEDLALWARLLETRNLPGIVIPALGAEG
jgi:hypothetical protein